AKGCLELRQIVAAELVGERHMRGTGTPDRLRVERHALLARADQQPWLGSAHPVPRPAALRVVVNRFLGCEGAVAPCRLVRDSIDRPNTKGLGKISRMPVSRAVFADQTLDLPPGYTLVALREHGDAFAHACAIAAKAGAGTLVWVRRYDLVEYAVVLEP